ncbi:unnamed protein product, partial [Effrenium voratum]
MGLESCGHRSALTEAAFGYSTLVAPVRMVLVSDLQAKWEVSSVGEADSTPKILTPVLQLATAYPKGPAEREAKKPTAPVQQESPVIIEEAPEAQAPPRPKPAPAKELDLGAFRAFPLGVPETAVQELFEEYLQRVPQPLVQSTEGWAALSVLQGGSDGELPQRGPLALEWFWLARSAASEATASAASAAGLCVFRLQRTCGRMVGQLLHFSVVDMEFLEEAVQSVKTLMFARLPITSIRVTLWCCEQTEDGKPRVNLELEAALQKQFFKWFQFANQRGQRGKVLNRPRADPPMDPEMPLEVPSFELCLGQ